MHTMSVSKIFISGLVNFRAASALRAARSAHARQRFAGVACRLNSFCLVLARRERGSFVLVILRNLLVKVQSNDLRNGRLRRERIGQVSDAFKSVNMR